MQIKMTAKGFEVNGKPTTTRLTVEKEKKQIGLMLMAAVLRGQKAA